MATGEAAGPEPEEGHSPCTEAGWAAGPGRGFLRALARLPLLPFTHVRNTTHADQSPEPADSPAKGGSVTLDVNNDVITTADPEGYNVPGTSLVVAQLTLTTL